MKSFDELMYFLTDDMEIGESRTITVKLVRTREPKWYERYWMNCFRIVAQKEGKQEWHPA